MRLVVHGARGSAPVSGADFLRYGGHTTCFEVSLPDGQRVIVDCGSGLRVLERALTAGADAPPFEATVLLTHFHWDHLQGLPFFQPLFDPATRLRFVAVPPAGFSIDGAIEAVMRPPWFPVVFRDAGARISVEPLGEGPLRVGALEVQGVGLHHPGGVTGFRLSLDGRSVVVATDVEAGDPSSDAAIRRLASGADVLIHDAQYTPREYAEQRRGWGHSTWEHAARVASDAGVGRLLLTSHEPDRRDTQVDAIAARARGLFAATDAAAEGLTIAL